jgi:hypothetical protein
LSSPSLLSSSFLPYSLLSAPGLPLPLSSTPPPPSAMPPLDRELNTHTVSDREMDFPTDSHLPADGPLEHSYVVWCATCCSPRRHACPLGEEHWRSIILSVPNHAAMQIIPSSPPPWSHTRQCFYNPHPASPPPPTTRSNTAAMERSPPALAARGVGTARGLLLGRLPGCDGP